MAHRKLRKDPPALIPHGMVIALRKRFYQLSGLMLLIFSFIIFFILYQYNPEMPSWNTAGETPDVLIWGDFWSVPSSLLADALLQLFGFSSFIICLGIGVWGGMFMYERQNVLSGWRVFSLLGCVFCFAAFLALFSNTGKMLVSPSYGGAIGQLLQLWCYKTLKGSLYGISKIAWLMGAFIFLHVALGLRLRHYKKIKDLLSVARKEGGKLQGKVRDTFSAPTKIFSSVLTHSSMVAEKEGEGQEVKDFKSFKKPNTSQAEFSDTTEANLSSRPARVVDIKKSVYEDFEGTPFGDEVEPQGPGIRLEEDMAAEDYELPSVTLLDEATGASQKEAMVSEETLQAAALQLEQVLQEFGVRGEIVGICPGPVVTLYELKPAPGIKTARVIGLADDIARSMSAHAARIAVIPGRNVIGIELPNPQRETVYLRHLLESEEYTRHPAPLAMIIGKDIGGNPIVVDLAKMPHLLVAGTTGSGKSVSINTMILSLLYRMPPDKCKFIMVDPKMLEFSAYDGIPHLLTPVVTDAKKAVVALKWAVREMENRYRAMSKLGVRNIDGYNHRLEEVRSSGEVLMRRVQTGFDPDTGKPIFENQALDITPLPYIVIVVDEMADLMLVAGKEIEATVQRLAQMARAAGIHLIMATQRPSVDVITGTIKANFPTRISFMVTSKIDSRTILGEQGAEQLLGQGDMLYMMGGGRITRVHGPFVKDIEVERVVKHLKMQAEPTYIDSVIEDDGDTSFGDSEGQKEGDALYHQAVEIVRREGKASTSFVQRHLQIGYNRAARIIEQMEKENIITPANSVGKREVIG